MSKWIYGLCLSGLVAAMPAQAKNANQECLTRAVYYEARNQPLMGQIAVAQVVLNRTRDSRFPSDICAVVYQRHKGRCQFSWVCRPQTAKREPEAWKLAAAVARFTLEGIPDQTNQALYFHARSVKPYWPHLRRVAHLGQHVFYTEKQRAAVRTSLTTNYVRAKQ